MFHDYKFRECRQVTELSLVLSFTVLSFIVNSLFLTLYFSGVISGFDSKHSANKDGFTMALAGSVVGALFSLVVSLLPVAVPIMDVAIGLVFLTWVLLIHYRFNEEWFEAIVQAIIGIIIYVVILALINGFLILWISM
jgi:hypothetical protein